MKTVIFCCDRQMLPGLHVSLLSMLESLSPVNPDPLHIIVFADKIPEPEKALLRKTYETKPGKATFEIQDYTAEKLEGGSDLHGNLTAYGIFHLATLLPDVSRCIYLDSDILVNTDVHKMFEYFDGRNILMVDGSAKRDWDRHKELYKIAGLDMSKPCFNSGIVGIDLDLWRAQKITDVCKRVALKYSHLLKGADQAILNVALHDNFLAWGQKYNTSLRLINPRINALEDAIYHFVGAPKPWDIFGKSLHDNYSIWNDVYQRTAIAKISPRRYSSFNRSRQISKSIIRVWLNKRKAKPKH